MAVFFNNGHTFGGKKRRLGEKINAPKKTAQIEVNVANNKADELSIYAKHWKNANLANSLNDPKKPWHAKRLEVILANIGEGSVLDIACATGEITEAISSLDRISSILGYDGSKELVAEAKRLHPAVNFTCGLVEKIPFKQNSFDWIHAGEIIEHVTEPEKLILNISKIAKVGLIITTPKDYVNDPAHICILSKQWMIEELSKHFFSVECFDTVKTFLYVCKDKKKVKKSVLWITDIPATKRGSWAQTIYQVSALSLKYDVTVLYKKTGSSVNIKQASNITFIGLLNYPVTVPRYIEGTDFDYYVTRGFEISLLTQKYIDKEKMFPYIYGGYWNSGKAGLESIFANANSVIVQGKGQLKHAKQLGLNKAKCYPIDCCSNNIRLPKVTIGYVGTLFAFQCADKAIDILDKLREDTDAGLLIVGNERSNGTKFKFENELAERIRTHKYIRWTNTDENNIDILYKCMLCSIAMFDLEHGRANEVTLKYGPYLLKTKIVESMTANVPVLCERTEPNIHLLGENYPLYVDGINDAVMKVKWLFAEKFKDDIKNHLDERSKFFSLEAISKRYVDLFEGDNNDK